MTKTRQWVIHPFLFCIYPIVAMVASNLTEMRLTDALRALLVSLLVTGVFFILLRALLQDGARAALVCSLGILLFFSYGHVYNLFRDSTVFGVYLFRHRMLGFIWLGAFLLGSWLIVRKLPRPPPAQLCAEHCGCGRPGDTPVQYHQLRGKNRQPASQAANQ